MNRLLIIGCGDVVRRALPDLARRWRLYALVREIDPSLRPFGVTQIRGDLDHPQTLRRLAGLAQAVLHSAPPPSAADAPDGDPRTRRLIASLSRGASLPSRLVYISTTGIYGDCAGNEVSETWPARPQTARARRRVAAEGLLRGFGRRTGCRVSILRAPGIYAADRLPLERLRRGDPVLRPEEDVYTNHIHAEDLGRACIAALRRGAPGRAYNASDDSDILMGDWFDRLAGAFGLSKPERVSRAEAAERLPPMMLSFMSESRRLGNARLKRELRLKLRYPTVDAGLSDAVRKSCSG